MKHYETIALRKQYIFFLKKMHISISEEEATEGNYHHYEHISRGHS